MYEFDWSSIAPSMPYLLQGLVVTLKITVTAVVFGILWGTVLAVMRLSPIAPIRWFAKGYVNIFRSIPLVMVLLWFYLVVPSLLQNVLGLSPKTDIRLISAMVAFSLLEAAYYSEIIRAGILSISRGQSSAALALGMTQRQSMKLVILPQAFRAMVPLLLTQGICLVPGHLAGLRVEPGGLLPHSVHHWRARWHSGGNGAVCRIGLFRY